MYNRLAHVAIVVKDYDEAIEFYTNIMDFDLLEDTHLEEGKRWVVVAPPGAKECSLLLAQAKNETQESAIGNQTGGRVFLFLHTDNFERDYQKLKVRNVNFIRERHVFPYGTVAVFEDLYGNLWDLIEPTKDNRGWLK